MATPALEKPVASLLHGAMQGTRPCAIAQRRARWKSYPSSRSYCASTTMAPSAPSSTNCWSEVNQDPLN
eukprot:2930663-Pyramimonas_sp.AAC.1